MGDSQPNKQLWQNIRSHRWRAVSSSHPRAIRARAVRFQPSRGPCEAPLAQHSPGEIALTRFDRVSPPSRGRRSIPSHTREQLSWGSPSGPPKTLHARSAPGLPSPLSRGVVPDALHLRWAQAFLPIGADLQRSLHKTPYRTAKVGMPLYLSGTAMELKNRLRLELSYCRPPNFFAEAKLSISIWPSVTPRYLSKVQPAPCS